MNNEQIISLHQRKDNLFKESITKTFYVINDLYIRAHKEDILDLIQYLCDVIRFADRKDIAPNKNLWGNYLKFAYSSWHRIFDDTDIENFLKNIKD